MTDAINIVVLDRDESLVADVRAAIAGEVNVRVLGANDATAGIAIVRQARPHVVLVGQRVPGLNALALCQSLRAMPEMQNATLVLVLDPQSPLGGEAGAQAGADHVLNRPVEPAALRLLLQTLRLRQRVLAERSAAELVIQELQHQLSDGSRHLDALLLRLVETRRPGAAERATHVHDLAMRLAARFGIPEEHTGELARASRLAELGEVVTPDEATRGNPQEARWARGRTAALLLAELPGYKTTAELLEAVHENWDGTGHPDHRQQGQIPLRSRILRLVLDFFGELERPNHPTHEGVLSRLQDHVGTLYDPMTLVHLKAALEGADDADLRGRTVRVPVDGLRVGMVLSEDLVTDSGLKLLSGGTRLSLETLDVIRRRHAMEPIVNGAAVLRDQAA